MKQHLLDTFAASTFNGCEHQKLPLMDGPELEMKVDKDATPTRVRVPATIPIYWKTKVKQSIDRDVEMGVLEWVPPNTPETWCSRMVVTPKHNGEPRRTVDLQGLNKASVRQTHHTEPPFRQASTIPHNTYKRVTDAKNGFHSVPIIERDRHFTTFITPWGRLRYRCSPQGYLASGDAYTHRFDKVTQDVENCKRNTDDSILFEDTIEGNYKATAAYLSLLGQHGILQNRDKFDFCQKTVTWSGFVISEDSVAPSPHITEAIRTFPTPQNATDLRSFYALVNQVAAYYAVAPQLEPVRDLLKKNTKWYWDETLDNLFKEMRQVVADEVEEGVKLFDYNKDTDNCPCPGDSIFCCSEGWKVALVGSRFTTRAESNYSPTEGSCSLSRTRSTRRNTSRWDAKDLR